MTYTLKTSTISLLLSGFSALSLGLATSSPAHAISGEDSDFIKYQNAGMDVKSHWSEYKNDGNGHEIFKNLTAKGEGGQIKIAEVDLDHFEYDPTTEKLNANHMTLKNVTIDKEKTTGTVDLVDLSKLRKTNDSFESDGKISNMTLKLKHPDEAGPSGESADDTPPITSVHISLITNHLLIDKDRLKMDTTVQLKDLGDIHLKGDFTGKDRVFQMLLSESDPLEKLGPDVAITLLLSKVYVNSVDVGLQDRGYLATKPKSANSDYQSQYERCLPAFGNFVREPESSCKAMANIWSGKEKNLEIHVKPDNPMQIMDIFAAIQDNDKSQIGTLLKKLNLSANN